MPPSSKEIQTQLSRLHQAGFYDMLTRNATANGLLPTFFFAIASRETNCRNILGDYKDKQAHGVGMVQIDVQHSIAQQARDNGSWLTNPEPLIAFGAQLLAANIQQARQTFPHLTADQHLKIAASGYNCGMARAISGQQAGDSDQHTTGRDYGADVLARKALFELAIGQAAAGAGS